MESPTRLYLQAQPEPPANSFEIDVQKGLSADPKWLPSVYFYDEHGSRIFEQICDLEEYYLTRKEAEILKRSAHEIIKTLPLNSRLVELGSGSSKKTRILLEAALAHFDHTRYSPIDVSETLLNETIENLSQQYPELTLEAVADRYEVGLERLLKHDGTPDCIMWLGSSMGNLTRDEAQAFLGTVRKQLGPRDSLLLGIDLRKSRVVLESAYNDAKRVTAAFNLNLLERINRELGGQFQVDNFRHQAVYNEVEGRVEMYLVSKLDQAVWIARLNRSFSFAKNEKILTEYSYKYSTTEIESLAESSGFLLEKQWLDEAGWFSLNYFKPENSVPKRHKS